MVYWTRRNARHGVGRGAAAGGVGLVPAVRSYGQARSCQKAELFLRTIENLTADGRSDALTDLFRSQLAAIRRVERINAARVDEMLSA